MKKALILSAFLILTSNCFAQDFKTAFDNYMTLGDTLKQREILIQWENAEPSNAELYTSYINYYFRLSRKEGISINMNPPKNEGFSITDSLGRTVGYLGSQVVYDMDIFQKGMDKIDKGIQLFPNRLDMRFGKIYSLGVVENWETFTNEIIKTIQYSAVNKNNWTWTYNEPLTDAEDFLLSAIQDYQVQLFETEDNDLLENMSLIAKEILIFYPNHIESLSNLSIVYLLSGEFEKGIETLQRAEKINPKDVIILANIAHGYKLDGNYAKSIEYYDKVIEHGNEEEKEFANHQISILKN